MRGKNTEVIEDIVPLYNVPLEVKVQKSIKNVYLAPSNKSVKFTQNGDCVSICVPEINCHQMVVLEY